MRSFGMCQHRYFFNRQNMINWNIISDWLSKQNASKKKSVKEKGILLRRRAVYLFILQPQPYTLKFIGFCVWDFKVQ